MPNNSHKWRKSALLPRQCTMSQVNRNDGKTAWIALHIVSVPTIFSRTGNQQLLAVCRPQKNAPKKDLAPMKKKTEAYFETKDKSFYEKGIMLLEKHWNQCITLEKKQTMLMNKIEFFLDVLLDSELIEWCVMVAYLIAQIKILGGRGCPHGVMVKAIDCGIVVSKFVLQSCYYVHFEANTLRKGVNPFILPAMG